MVPVPGIYSGDGFGLVTGFQSRGGYLKCHYPRRAGGGLIMHYIVKGFEGRALEAGRITTNSLNIFLHNMIRDKGNMKVWKSAAVCAQRSPCAVQNCLENGVLHSVGGMPCIQGCIRREGILDAVPEAVGQAVGGGCQSGWRRLLSVANAIEPGICRQGDSGMGMGMGMDGVVVLSTRRGAPRVSLSCGCLFGLVRHPGTATAMAEARVKQLCGAVCCVLSHRLSPVVGLSW